MLPTAHQGLCPRVGWAVAPWVRVGVLVRARRPSGTCEEEVPARFSTPHPALLLREPWLGRRKAMPPYHPVAGREGFVC